MLENLVAPLHLIKLIQESGVLIDGAAKVWASGFNSSYRIDWMISLK